MGKHKRPVQDRSNTGYGLDLLLGILVFAAALAVRWQYVQAIVFPPLGDPAFFLTTAENVIARQALEVDVLWNYQPSFASITHPSHERLMPLTTGLIAAAYAVERFFSGALQASLRTGQMASLVVGALLAPLTYLIGRRVLPGRPGTTLGSSKGSRSVSLGAALLIAANGMLSYQSASADSSALFALLAAWALSLAVRKPGEQGGYFGAGLLVALACLTQVSGLLLLLSIPLAWWLLPLPARARIELPDNPAAELAWKYWPRQRVVNNGQPGTLGPSLRNVLDLAVAFALVVAPWLIRNHLAFGTALPTSPVSQAWLTHYLDSFNFWSHPTWQTWLAQDWQTLLDQRVQALLANGQILWSSTRPWLVLTLPGMWLLRREWSFFPSIVYSLLLFFGLALVFPLLSASGSLYRSLGAMMPFLALAAVYAVQRATQPFRRYPRFANALAVSAFVALLALSLNYSPQRLPTITERHQADKEQFQTAAAWLAEYADPGDVVMTTQPYTLNYASDHPTIALPGNEPPDAAWEAAQRYKARYLVITEPFGLYPLVLQEQPDPRFRLLEEMDTTLIYEIVGGQR